MSAYIGPVTNSVIDGIIKELKKKKTKDKIIKDIVDPLLCDLATRYYSHFLTIVIILFVIVLLLITILILTVLNQHKSI
jgi:hypothetical protein